MTVGRSKRLEVTHPLPTQRALQYQTQASQDDSDAGTHIEQDAFPILTEILDRISKAGGRLGAQEEWFEELFPPAPAVFRYERKTARSDEDTRALDAKEILRHASRALKHLLDCVSRQATVAEEHVKASQLRKGTSSMPDEVLSLILEYAAIASIDKNNLYNKPLFARAMVKAATKLSHTCQRFRHLLVAVPILWNRIYSTMSSGMISTCFNRLMAANAEVHLSAKDSLSVRPCSLKDFIGVAIQHSRNWRQFQQHGSCSARPGSLQKVARASLNLDVPFLSELCLEHWHSPGETRTAMEDVNGYQKALQKALHFYSTWHMPRLSSLKTENLIPIPFKNPVSLRTLNIGIRQKPVYCERFDIRALTSFLASCEALEALVLEFEDIENTPNLPQLGPSVILDCVTKASFTVESCNDEFLLSLFNAIRMPVLSTMEVELSVNHQEDIPNAEIDYTLFSVFPNASTFQKLVDLVLDFEIFEKDGQLLNDEAGAALPFSCLPSLRRLTFRSWYTRLELAPGGKILPSLEFLAMENCCELYDEWIVSFLGRLIHQGKLLPSHLKVVECTRAHTGPAYDANGQEMFYEVVKLSAEEMLQMIM